MGVIRYWNHMNKVEYSKSQIVDILKDINEFVVSLDQIDTVFHELGEEAWKKELIDYLISSQLSQRLSKVRTTLSAPFPTELGEDDMDYLERNMESVKYWTFSEYLNRKGIAK